jgi:hypothetical protein
MTEHDPKDRAGQVARAERLRGRIEQIKAGQPTAPSKESPHEFVERRMREEEEKKRRKKG